MSHFLSGLPLWLAVLLLVVLPTAVAICGLIFSRRWLSQENLTSNNEIAGFKFATVGVIYSVLLAFSVIVVWEKFNEAETSVAQEAGAAATLYRLAGAVDPGKDTIKSALTNYLKLAIDRDWPQMAKQKGSREATAALDALYNTAIHAAEDPSRPSAIIIEMFKQPDSITQARRIRLHLATGIVPSIMWLALSGGAVLTVGFRFFSAPGTCGLRS